MKNIRIFWVDSLRGIAIIGMLIFHTAFILDMLKIFPINVHAGLWLFLARFVQFTFLTLVGFSLYLSYIKYDSHKEFLKRQTARGIKLMLVALGITAVTYFVFPESYIRFGVLHFIAAAIILGALIIRFPIAAYAMVFVSLILGSLFTHITAHTSLLIPIGITPKYFYTLDYFPLFPWFALVCFGIAAARFMDKRGMLLRYSCFLKSGFLEFLGRKSLLIYLIHLPLIYGFILLILR